MSSERLEELGVPRRAFLKRAGAAALAAPLIVSFGLDAVAEGATGQSQPNQCLANQSLPNQTEEFPPVFNILQSFWDAVSIGRKLSPPINLSSVQALANLAVNALLLEAADEFLQADREWTQFINEVNATANHLPQQVKEEVIRDARAAQARLDCN